MTPELRKICEQVLELKKSATQVSGWYPHSQYENYRPGCATVRGPGFRWFVVERGTEDYQKHLADQYDDAKFCAFAMNHVVELAEALLAKSKNEDGDCRERVRSFSLLGD